MIDLISNAIADWGLKRNKAKQVKRECTCCHRLDFTTCLFALGGRRFCKRCKNAIMGGL